MPKVKLIKVYAPYCDYCDNSIVSKDITEWDNVTDKELKLLKYFVKTKNDKYDSDEKYILVNYQNLEMSPQSTISQYLNEIEKEKEKQKKIKEAVNKRKKTVTHKRMMKEKYG